MVVITEWLQREDSKAAVTMKKLTWDLIQTATGWTQLLKSVISVQRNKVGLENRGQVIDGY